MNKKLWSNFNKIEESFIDLEGIKQHLNFAVDSDSSKSELESAIYFVVRLLDRYEEDMTTTLASIWEGYREDVNRTNATKTKDELNNIDDYSQLIKSKLL
jgi:hypothetical protein